MIENFKALSEESRLRILSLLMHNDMCVCELEKCLEQKQSNISRHLSALKNSGIVVSYKQGQWVYHKINATFIKEHPLLWKYLEEGLTKLNSYSEDFSRMQTFKRENICNTNKL